MTVDQAADILDVTPHSVRRYVREGKLEGKPKRTRSTYVTGRWAKAQPVVRTRMILDIDGRSVQKLRRARTKSGG